MGNNVYSGTLQVTNGKGAVTTTVNGDNADLSLGGGSHSNLPVGNAKAAPQGTGGGGGSGNIVTGHAGSLEVNDEYGNPASSF